jgi:hypothetical protein
MLVQPKQSERGAALIISLMMLLALGFVGAALIFTAGGDLKVAGADRRGTQAQSAAEAGIQEALHRLALSAGTTVSVNGETFDAAIRDTTTNLDPDWEVRIYSPVESSPAADGSLEYTPTVQPDGTDLDYLRDGSFLSIRHKWIDRNGDDIRDANELVRYDAARIPPENFDAGSPIEVVTVAGHRTDARRSLVVETTRYPFTPNVFAALTSNEKVDVRGNVHVCGMNHQASTPTFTDLETNPPCSPNYDETSGHLSGITTTGDKIDVKGSTDILGQPSAIDTSSTNPFYTLAEALGVTQDVIDQVLTDPDHTSATDAPPLEGIVYINGDATGGQRFNDTSGQGLIYVTGDMAIAGNFTWRGLIYVEGDVTITGTPWILGALMVEGDTEYAFGGGTPNILYSREMLQLALEMAFDYVVLSWKEL